jgi:hypothetical protein
MTVKIKASDLNDYKYHYSWTTKYAGDESIAIGNPDIEVLDRNQGYEMLYFINCFMENCDFRRKIDALKAERLIKEYMPSYLISHAQIREWLKNNWHNPGKEYDYGDYEGSQYRPRSYIESV